MRKAVFTALEIRDEAGIIHALPRGELESRILAGERAQASAPPDVTGTLRLTAQAEADALQQSAAAEVQHDETGAASARSLAGRLAAERQRLESGNARYEQWAADTHPIRETAGKAPSRTPAPRPGPARQRTAGHARMVAQARSRLRSRRTRHRPTAPGRHRRRRSLAAPTRPRASSEHEPGG